MVIIICVHNLLCLLCCFRQWKIYRLVVKLRRRNPKVLRSKVVCRQRYSLTFSHKIIFWLFIFVVKVCLFKIVFLKLSFSKTSNNFNMNYQILFCITQSHMFLFVSKQLEDQYMMQCALQKSSYKPHFHELINGNSNKKVCPCKSEFSSILLLQEHLKTCFFKLH